MLQSHVLNEVFIDLCKSAGRKVLTGFPSLQVPSPDKRKVLIKGKSDFANLPGFKKSKIKQSVAIILKYG